MLVFLIRIITLINSVFSHPQPKFAHGIPNTLLIALNQISSSSTFTFSVLQNLLLDTLSESNFLTLINYGGSQTFIAPTDEAFAEFYSNSSGLSGYSGFPSIIRNDSLRLLEYHSIPVQILFKEIQFKGFTPFTTREGNDVKIGRDENGTISIEGGFKATSTVLMTHSLVQFQIYVVDRVLIPPSSSLRSTLEYFSSTATYASRIWEWQDIQYQHSNQTSTLAAEMFPRTYFIPSDKAIQEYASSINQTTLSLLNDTEWKSSLISNHTMGPGNECEYSFMLYGPHFTMSNHSIIVFRNVNVKEGKGTFQVFTSTNISRLVRVIEADVILDRRRVFHVLDSFF